MKKFFFVLAITFAVLFITNVAWIIVNIYMFSVHGIESVVTGETLIENIYFSMYLRWIVLFDVILIDSNLTGADLRGAELRYANLRGADLRGADLSGADLFDVITGIPETIASKFVNPNTSQ